MQHFYTYRNHTWRFQDFQDVEISHRSATCAPRSYAKFFEVLPCILRMFQGSVWAFSNSSFQEDPQVFFNISLSNFRAVFGHYFGDLPTLLGLFLEGLQVSLIFLQYSLRFGSLQAIYGHFPIYGPHPISKLWKMSLNLTIQQSHFIDLEKF